MVRLLLAAGTESFGVALQDGLVHQLPILAVMILLLPIFIRDTLKLSNRFAGPMYRLRTELRKLATDQPGNAVKFRTGDFWQEVAGDFNHVLGQLERLQSENESLRSELKSAAKDEEALV
jgi:nitrogen fixation/metabolism regulation signal transduction histidine kinase